MSKKRPKFFEMIRREAEPDLEVLGFAEVPTPRPFASMILLMRDLNRGLAVSFQRDCKAYAVDVIGSKFTVEVENGKWRQRVYFLLKRQELEQMRCIQNAIVGRMPNGDVRTLRGFGLYDFEFPLVRMNLQAVDKPFNPRHEEWMRYRDEDDLRRWLEFLRPLWKKLIERFLADPSKGFPASPS